MKENIVTELAKAISEAYEIHEVLFNQEAARLEEESRVRRYGETAYIDYGYFYHWTLEECLEHTFKKYGVPEPLLRVVCLASDWGNDLLEWCDEILMPK